MAASRWPNQATFITILCIFWSKGALTSHLPLLIWSTDSLPPVASPAAGHITSSSELSAFLTSALGSGIHTVLLFLQDKLSQDDFTVYGGVYGSKEGSAFKNVEAALQSHSVVFPALEWTGSSAVPALLEEKLGVSPALVALDTFPDLQMDSSVNNLLLVNLPYCAQDKPCRETLRENDETIGQVLKTLQDKNVPYTAIFTGLQPSRIIAEPSLSEASVGRTLLQAAAVTAEVHPPIMYNASGSPCIMLWAQNLFVSFSANGNWTDLATLTPSFTGSMCSATNSVLALTYPGGITLSFFMSRRFYPVSARFWFTLDSVQLRQNAVTGTFSSRFITAPAEYSYHCQSVTSLRDPLLTPINQTTFRLNLVDFQIQGFGLNNGTNFSYASDCAGFFTPAIWMGLVTGLIMLWIFVYGLHMILQLNTMDRFDDPKAPCISVPQTE